MPSPCKEKRTQKALPRDAYSPVRKQLTESREEQMKAPTATSCPDLTGQRNKYSAMRSIAGVITACRKSEGGNTIDQSLNNNKVRLEGQQLISSATRNELGQHSSSGSLEHQYISSGTNPYTILEEYLEDMKRMQFNVVYSSLSKSALNLYTRSKRQRVQRNYMPKDR